MTVSYITIAWSMAASACAMMGLSHILLWFKERRRAMYLLSSVMAFSAAAGAMTELALLRAQTALEYQTLLRWENLCVYLLLVSMVWFVYLRLGTARRWLGVAITALWTVGIVVNFASPGSLVYREIESLHTQHSFWGESFTLGTGPPNPWKILADLASLLILAYVIDASIRAWRRGDRPRAAIVGGSIVLFMISAGTHAPMVDAGLVATPYMVSFAFLAIVFAMTYELASTAFLASNYARRIQAEERRWRTLLENVQLPVVGLDRDGRAQFVNPYCLALLGFDESEIIGKPWIERVVAQGDRARREALFRDRLLKGDLPTHQGRIVSSAGEVLEVKWSNVVLVDAEGTVTGSLSIGENLTPRTRAEQELRRQREVLTHMTRVSAMGELVASLAHEINQPLTAMLSNAQAARRFMAADAPDLDDVRDILGDLVKDNKRASSIIRRLRGLVTKEHREFEPVDLRRVADDVVQLLHSDAVIRQVHVDVHSPSRPALVSGDEIQLQQVILNLLQNAFDAVSQRPVNERGVSVGIARAGGSWEIRVTDQGPGLPPGRLSELFEPFFSTKHGGIGMGLAISRSIVEVHGGSLWAENNPQRGATFCFTVPAVEAERTRDAVA